MQRLRYKNVYFKNISKETSHNVEIFETVYFVTQWLRIKNTCFGDFA